MTASSSARHSRSNGAEFCDVTPLSSLSCRRGLPVSGHSACRHEDHPMCGRGRGKCHSFRRRHTYTAAGPSDLAQRSHHFRHRPRLSEGWSPLLGLNYPEQPGHSEAQHYLPLWTSVGRSAMLSTSFIERSTERSTAVVNKYRSSARQHPRQPRAEARGRGSPNETRPLPRPELQTSAPPRRQGIRHT